MKDIYELLNDLDMKDDDFEEMEVSDIERAIVKKNLKKSIRNKRSKTKAISVAAMAIACTVVLGTTITYAEDIPIIRDIFKALDNKIYEDYKDSANEINATQVSNGISVTMNDAVFDGRTVSLTFTIESEKDFGKSITMYNRVRIKDMEEYAMTCGYKFERFHGNTYIGLMDMTILDLIDKPLENIGFTLDISKIGNLMRDEDFVEGDWCFDLNLEAVAGNVINVDSAVTNEGITAKVKDLTINPMSIFIAYTYEIIEEATENGMR